MSHRWTHPKPLNRSEETITQGDTFTPTDAELSAFTGRIATVDDSNSSTSTETVDTPYDPNEHTIKELRTMLNDLSDSQREALVAAERDGKNRETAIQVLSP